MQTDTLNHAPLMVEWGDNLKEVEEAKKIYQRARREGRQIVDMAGVPIVVFKPSLLAFRVEGKAIPEGHLAVRVFNETGDETFTWDANDPTEVAEMAKLFEDYLAKGFRAFAISLDGTRKRQITKFDREAEEITFVEPGAVQTFKEKIRDFAAKFGKTPVHVVPPTYPG